MKSNVNIDISFFGILTIVFIVLKLTKVINWSWWWVLAPTWIPIAIVAIIVVVIMVKNKMQSRKRW